LIDIALLPQRASGQLLSEIFFILR
jgi:hypothetical protein